MPQAAPLALHFVLDPRATCWPDLERLDERDIEAIPERFVGGRNSWIAQTLRGVPGRQRLASRWHKGLVALERGPPPAWLPGVRSRVSGRFCP